MTIDDGPIAVVGIGLRFPGDAEDGASFWSVLEDGASLAALAPAERWVGLPRVENMQDAVYSIFGGFLRDLELWDPYRYGLTEAEALRIDPQHRLLMDVVWSALENSAIDPLSLSDTPTGIFVGVSDSQQYTMLQKEVEREFFRDPFVALGNSASVAAGRLAHWLNTSGPALTVDTACSTSLVATHLAVQSLLRRECDLAVVAAASAILHPGAYAAVYDMGMVSRDGRCKTFSRSADGLGIGEGAAALVLERQQDAEARDRVVRAIVRGSAVNQDGNSGLLMAPKRKAQSAVIAAALDRAGLAGEEIDFVEAHGSGTALGDAVELQALSDVFCAPQRDAPLPIGAVKSLTGHLLVAAGMASLVKVVLELEHRVLTPNAPADDPNPVLRRLPQLRPVETRVELAPDISLRAGVSAFGWSGTNAHIVLESAPPRLAPSRGAGPYILTLAADTADQLREFATQLSEWVADRHDDAADIAATLHRGRSMRRVRVALPVADPADLVTRCRAVGAGEVDVIETGGEPRVMIYMPDDHCAGPYVVSSRILGRAHEVAAGFGPQVVERIGVAAGVVTDTTTSIRQTSTSVWPAVGDQLALFAIRVASATAVRDAGVHVVDVCGAGLAGVAAAVVRGERPLEEVLPELRDAARTRAGHAATRSAEVETSDLTRRATVRLVIGADLNEASSAPFDGETVRVTLGGSDPTVSWEHACARLWELGARVDLYSLLESSSALVDLPPHPAARIRLWPEHRPPSESNGSAAPPPRVIHSDDRELAVYVRRWTEIDEAPRNAWADAREGLVVLSGADPVLVRGARTTFEQRGWRAVILDDPSETARDALLGQAGTDEALHLVDLGGVDARADVDAGVAVDAFERLARLLQLFGGVRGARLSSVLAVTTGGADVTGAEDLSLGAAVTRGLLRASVTEYRPVRIRVLDLALADARSAVDTLAGRMADELDLMTCIPPSRSMDEPLLVAERNGRRWKVALAPLARDAPVASQLGGVAAWQPGIACVVTGGTRGLGMRFARHLASSGVRPRLCLVGRTRMPRREEWPAILCDRRDAHVIETIEGVLEIESAGGSVLLVCADVARPAAMGRILDLTATHYGGIGAVVHCAGVPGSGLLQTKSRVDAEPVLATKIRPLEAINAWIREGRLKTVVLFSSAVTEYQSLGESDYAAANMALVQFAHAHRNSPARVVAVDWGPWQHNGFSAALEATGSGGLSEHIDAYRQSIGIRDEEGMRVLDDLVRRRSPSFVVLPERHEHMAERFAALGADETLDQLIPNRPVQPRPALRVLYRTPSSPMQERIAKIVADVLGLDRVGLDDPFFELGGTSLLAIVAIRRLERELACPIGPAALLEYPTVALVSEFLEDMGAAGSIDSSPSLSGQ